MDDQETAMIILFASTAFIGLGIGIILSKFHLPYIWTHKVSLSCFVYFDFHKIDFFTYFLYGIGIILEYRSKKSSLITGFF